MNLHQHIAIISGSLGDIGRAIALELASHGAAVALGDIRPMHESVDLLEQLAKLGVRCRYDRVDVADAGAVQEWVQTVEREMGVATLIVPNAAVVAGASALKVTPEHWRREMSINLDGAVFLAQAGAQRLVHHKKPGRIVFIGSWAAHAPHQGIAAYSVSKAGLRMYCQCLALTLAEHDILVNEVAPGHVDAGLSGEIFKRHPERREASLRRVPIHRLIEAADVAREVAHLCDPAVRHTTGAAIVMDGGLSLRATLG